jgi:hypothetical protein
MILPGLMMVHGGCATLSSVAAGVIRFVSLFSVDERDEFDMLPAWGSEGSLVSAVVRLGEVRVCAGVTTGVDGIFPRDALVIFPSGKESTSHLSWGVMV